MSRASPEKRDANTGGEYLEYANDGISVQIGKSGTVEGFGFYYTFLGNMNSSNASTDTGIQAGADLPHHHQPGGRRSKILIPSDVLERARKARCQSESVHLTLNEPPGVISTSKPRWMS